MNVSNRTIELDPDFRRLMKTKIRGTRTRHVIAFNPNKANPGEVIYIDTPKLKADDKGANTKNGWRSSI